MKTVKHASPGIRTAEDGYYPFITVFFTDDTVMNYVASGPDHHHANVRHAERALRTTLDDILSNYDLENPAHVHKSACEVLSVLNAQPDTDDPAYALDNLQYEEPKPRTTSRKQKAPSTDEAE